LPLLSSQLHFLASLVFICREKMSTQISRQLGTLWQEIQFELKKMNNALNESELYLDQMEGSDSEETFCFPESLLAFDDVTVQQFFQSAFQPQNTRV